MDYDLIRFVLLAFGTALGMMGYAIRAQSVSLGTMNTRLKDKQKQVDTLRATIDGSMNKEIAELKASFQTHTQQISELTAKVNHLTGEKTALMETNVKMREENYAAHQTIGEKNEQIRLLTEEKNALLKLIEDKEKISQQDRTKFQAEIAEKDKRIAELTLEVKALHQAEPTPPAGDPPPVLEEKADPNQAAAEGSTQPTAGESTSLALVVVENSHSQ